MFHEVIKWPETVLLCEKEARNINATSLFNSKYFFTIKHFHCDVSWQAGDPCCVQCKTILLLCVDVVWLARMRRRVCACVRACMSACVHGSARTYASRPASRRTRLSRWLTHRVGWWHWLLEGARTHMLHTSRRKALVNFWQVCVCVTVW